MLRALYVLPLTVLLGCSSPEADAGEAPDASSGTLGGGTTTTTTPPATRSPVPTPNAIPDADLLEVVNVLIDGEHGLCTGTLISKTVVVTAAHCLDKSLFKTWEVAAVRAPGAPRAKASWVAQYMEGFDQVEVPDIGVIVLQDGIDLPAYAQLTDATARVSNHAKIPGVAMVRSFIDEDAPFEVVDRLDVSSGEPYGYSHGLVTKLFSKSGDSGAGLFLVEDGRRTHKLIGVERQPEPGRNLDHFTSTDAAFITWATSIK